MVTAMQSADATQARDPQRPARLLRAEYDALLPILQRTAEPALDRPTVCPGWSIRDVLAHCGAALSRVTVGDLHAFTPELNEIDVACRRSWPLQKLLSELADGYLEAGSAIGDAGGRLDGIAFGVWLHGGDARTSLREPDAYVSDGFEDACILLADVSRRRAVPLVEARLPGATLRLGVRVPGRPPATLACGHATLMRLFSGRPTERDSYNLAGATAAELIVF
jgi:uncharacterized protein (TIGR03083 family)